MKEAFLGICCLSLRSPPHSKKLLDHPASDCHIVVHGAVEPNPDDEDCSRQRDGNRKKDPSARQKHERTTTRWVTLGKLHKVGTEDGLAYSVS